MSDFPIGMIFAAQSFSVFGRLLVPGQLSLKSMEMVPLAPAPPPPPRLLLHRPLPRAATESASWSRPTRTCREGGGASPGEVTF